MSIFSAISIASSTSIKIANGALDFRVPKQELDRAKIARAPVDQHRLRTSQRVRSELRRIKSDTGNPLVDEPSVLSRCQSVGSIASTSK